MRKAEVKCRQIGWGSVAGKQGGDTKLWLEDLGYRVFWLLGWAPPYCVIPMKWSHREGETGCCRKRDDWRQEIPGRWETGQKDSDKRRDASSILTERKVENTEHRWRWLVARWSCDRLWACVFSVKCAVSAEKLNKQKVFKKKKSN